MAIKLIPPGTGFARLTEAVTTEYGQLVELVRQALAVKVRNVPGMSEYYVNICVLDTYTIKHIKSPHRYAEAPLTRPQLSALKVWRSE